MVELEKKEEKCKNFYFEDKKILIFSEFEIGALQIPKQIIFVFFFFSFFPHTKYI